MTLTLPAQTDDMGDNYRVRCAWVPCSARIEKPNTWCSEECKAASLAELDDLITHRRPLLLFPAHRRREQPVKTLKP